MRRRRRQPETPGHEVPGDRDQQGGTRAQRTRRYGGGDRVRRIVEPVRICEEQSRGDYPDQSHKLHAQDSLMAIASTVFATCSKASAAFSSWSTTSLSFKTVNAS